MAARPNPSPTARPTTPTPYDTYASVEVDEPSLSRAIVGGGTGCSAATALEAATGGAGGDALSAGAAASAGGAGGAFGSLRSSSGTVSFSPEVSVTRADALKKPGALASTMCSPGFAGNSTPSTAGGTGLPSTVTVTFASLGA